MADNPSINNATTREQTMQHVLTLRAYARKSEMGGGFRGSVIDHRATTPTRVESDVLSTYEQARDWTIRTAANLMGDTPYRRASINSGSAGRLYRANIWA